MWKSEKAVFIKNPKKHMAVKACQYFVCRMGCLLAALAAFMFFLAPLEPGEVSLSAGWALTAVSVWLCRALYKISGDDFYEKNK